MSSQARFGRQQYDTVAAASLTPLRKPGITSGTSRPARPSPSPRQSPRWLWRHPCCKSVKLRQQKEYKNKFAKHRHELLLSDTQHAQLRTTESPVSREKRHHVMFGAPLSTNLRRYGNISELVANSKRKRKLTRSPDARFPAVRFLYCCRRGETELLSQCARVFVEHVRYTDRLK